MKMNVDQTGNIKNSDQWLENLGKQAPKLTIYIKSLLISLKDEYTIKFFVGKEEQSGTWDETKKVINLNAASPNIWIIEDLITMLYDINNPDHESCPYEIFYNGRSYADAKIKAQYQAFKKGYQLICNWAKNNPDEYKKLIGSEQAGETWLQEVQEDGQLSLQDYANKGEDIDNFFINDWNDWHISRTDTLGLTTD